MPMARALRVFEAPRQDGRRMSSLPPSVGAPKKSGGITLFDFHRGMLHGGAVMASEEDRTRLIGEIARILREDGPVPDDARTGALTFIGWLARRMPGEIPHAAGVPEMLKRSAARASVLAPAPRSRRLR
jgi:hypothetical protein